MKSFESIEFLNKLKKGDFCTVKIPLTNSSNQTIPITAMYMGKDADGRYNFMDSGRLTLPKKLIEENSIIIDKEYDPIEANRIHKHIRLLQSRKNRNR